MSVGRRAWKSEARKRKASMACLVLGSALVPRRSLQKCRCMILSRYHRFSGGFGPFTIYVPLPAPEQTHAGENQERHF